MNDPIAAIDAIAQINAVPTILDVVCKITGMRFAAVARVTADRWIACSVRDEIAFGLAPGGELKIETTICNEIREHRQAVIIDNVADDPVYAGHHTPEIYGLQSYISMPITLADGSFFGTLCAIDTVPRRCGMALNSALRSGSCDPPPPVPVGSPVCAMKPSITRWKASPS